MACSEWQPILWLVPFSFDRPWARSDGGDLRWIHRAAPGQTGGGDHPIGLRGRADPHAAHHAGHLQHALPGHPHGRYQAFHSHDRISCLVLSRGVRGTAD